MKTMRERCIEKAAEKIERCLGPLVGSPEYLADPVKCARAEERRSAAARTHATAAVDAILDELREPDERMLGAGDKSRDVLAPARTNTERTWTAMIDHARNPGGSA